MTSFGVRKPCRLRGRLLRMSATRLRSSAVWTDRSLPLGKYWHSISSLRSRSTILYLTLTGFAVVVAIEG